MSAKTKKPFRRVGVGAQYQCFGDPLNNIPYDEEIIKNETVTSIETTEGGGTTNVYASNKVYDVDKSREAPSMSVENVAFDPEDLARAKGERRQGAFIVSNQNDEPAHFAYGIVFPKRGGHFRFVWYPRCVLTEVSDAAQTMDDSGPNTQNPQSTIQTLPFNSAGDFRIMYETDMVAAGKPVMTEEEFFKEVLTEIPTMPEEPEIPEG